MEERKGAYGELGTDEISPWWEGLKELVGGAQLTAEP